MSNQRTNQTFLFKRIIPIASNTFREAVRDRVLYNLVLFVLLLTASAIFLGELTAGQETRTIVNLGLSATLLFGTFIAIFVGVSLVSKEIERRTVYAIFSKPIGRGEFIIGKYLGLCLTLLVNVLIMGVGVSLALLYFKTRQTDGELLKDVLGQYERETLPVHNWQLRMRNQPTSILKSMKSNNSI